MGDSVKGILTRANPNIRIFDDESADFSQIFEDLAKYSAKYSDSSNPNRASGGSNIRFAVHWGDFDWPLYVGEIVWPLPIYSVFASLSVTGGK